MAKAGDLLKAKMPTGQTVDIGKASNWIGYILGAGFLLTTFAWGQRASQELNKRLPANLQESIDSLTGEAKKETNYNVI